MLDKSLQLLQEINFQHNKSRYLEYKLFQVYWKSIFSRVVYTHHDLVKITVSLFEVLRVKTSNFLPSAIKNKHRQQQNPQTHAKSRESPRPSCRSTANLHGIYHLSYNLNVTSITQTDKLNRKTLSFYFNSTMICKTQLVISKKGW